jgi:hypothetical protein
VRLSGCPRTRLYWTVAHGNSLKEGKRTSHPELFLFTSWGEVQEYVEHDTAGQDLKAIVKLVDTHGTDEIIHALRSLSSEQHAKVRWTTTECSAACRPPRPAWSTSRSRAPASADPAGRMISTCGSDAEQA